MSEIKTNILETNDGNLVFYTFSDEKKENTILFIHGLAPITSKFKETFSNQYREYDLSGYSWLIPNLLGFGDSEKPDKLDVYTMENQSQYLYELLLLEKIRKVIIVAHSMGGPIAISLVNKIKNQPNDGIKVISLFYLEGNLDKNDAFFSSTIARHSFEQFKSNFDNWVDDIIKQTKSVEFEGYRSSGPFAVWGSAFDLVKVSEDNQLLPRLKGLLDFPVYFIFGEKNKGRFTSEELIRSNGYTIHFIPNTGHMMFFENPKEFWRIFKELLISIN